MRRVPRRCVWLATCITASMIASPAHARDRIIGATAPSGGAVLLKEFFVSAGSAVTGATFASNDPSTIFPRVFLLTGPVRSMRDIRPLAQASDVRTPRDHMVHVEFAGVVLEADA